jgi:lipopolysaccharide/colanic/teichoic acid biosynthesis glycosyltransferase
LIDVISGRLALVGVRPLGKIDELTYTEDWAKQRFEAPAGLFTPVDAEAMNEALEEEKVMAENLYVAKRSFREDVKVLLKALRNLILRPTRNEHVNPSDN